MKQDDQDETGWTRWLALSGFCTILVLLLPPVREFFFIEGIRWLYIFLLAFTTSLALTPVMIRLGRQWGLVDQPSERKIHRKPTPRIGGVAVYLGFAGAVLANSVLLSDMGTILLAGSLLLVVGVWDDASELPAWGKLAAQMLASGLVIYSGVLLHLLPQGPVGNVINVFLTFLWIVGITNAFNFFDGMDGLAAGTAMLMAFFMGLVAYETDQPALAWLAVAITGASLGFFPYNFRTGQKPALIFLGDGGSTFLGFTLACLAVKGNWADNNPIVSFSNPLLIFGVLIYDMIHITVERIVTGKVGTIKEWIDYVGTDHLHHRLARVLGSKRASVDVIFALTICLGLSAIVLRNADTRDAILLLAQAALIVILITILERRAH
ncbi:MAG: undecaprenyl/decaprenyl-phosphate alpha-N-acetylglucosaminyl 1-phosphate transferase [Nitrospirae bacterium]|nr:MAG: undecaprenyl/decaprenyl-phosphate alpha-N-acetylglucosaminyl 1-phosphate transferase [Nitrospirota bacterium]